MSCFNVAITIVGVVVYAIFVVFVAVVAVVAVATCVIVVIVVIPILTLCGMLPLPVSLLILLASLFVDDVISSSLCFPVTVFL